MKKIYENQFAQIFFDDIRKIMKTQWLENSENITEDELKTSITKAGELVEQFKPYFQLADNTNQKFTFNVDIQEWVAHHVAAPCIKVGVKKIAILMPSDLLAELSTEQAAEENKLPIEISYFKAEQEALKWFGF